MQTYLISSGLYYNHGYPWCTFHISKGFFCFLFYSFLLIPHPGMKTTAWQCKKDAETSSSLLKWHFSLCFYVSYCFSVHYWLSDMLCYGIFFLLVSNVREYCNSLCNVYCLENKMKCGSRGNWWLFALFWLYRWILNVWRCV